uniref:FZ domain-containing protein n=1 Tax=Macrostomum lignano TaxID=282301 RepID=A0A1I8F494_9PLAT
MGSIKVSKRTRRAPKREGSVASNKLSGKHPADPSHQQSAASAVGSRASLGQSLGPRCGPQRIGGVGRHLSGGARILSVSAPKKCQLISVPIVPQHWLQLHLHAQPVWRRHAGRRRVPSGAPVLALVEISCSQDLRFFLCSMYVPICMHNYDRHLPACRLRLPARQEGLRAADATVRFSWPEKMDCSKTAR